MGGALRILVLSNFYPPFSIGGYELGCHDIVEHLSARGHEVCVLTSSYGVDRPRVEGDVYRQLSIRTGACRRSLLSLLKFELRDQGLLKRLLRELCPDAVVVFNLSNVSHGILLTLQRTGALVVFAFSDQWLQMEYPGDPWLNLWTRKAVHSWKQAIKRPLRRAIDLLTPVGVEPIEVRHAFFTSRRLKELYIARRFPVESAGIIHWGVDTDRFRPRDRLGHSGVPKLLFAGRIHPEKGPLTAIEALGHIKESGELGDALLSIVGPIQDDGYFKRIEDAIGQFRLQKNVRFMGKLPRDSMPDVYREHDIFVFPSVWEEPFSIALLEAMASGLAVVGTTTGGSGEVLEDYVNALTFRAGDSHGMASRMGELLADSSLRMRLSANARRTVLERFDLQKMVDRIEGYIREVVELREE